MGRAKFSVKWDPIRIDQCRITASAGHVGELAVERLPRCFQIAGQADAEARQGSLPNSKNRHIQMNKSALSIACALVVASTAFAADVVTTTTTSTGTIHEYSPGTTFVVKESSGPVKYRYSKKVTYVTKGGKTLTDDEVKTRIKVGVPVSVHYATEGEDRVINKIEVDDD